MDRPVAIEVKHLDKHFDRPGRANVSLRERVRHPLTRGRRRELRVLDDISFDVGRGEFFGIVGRNGSGKSTLLKLLASIYRADRGTIRVGGRLAPFIELGVGFRPDLAARDNVVVNGVMMGLTPAVARQRFEEIVAFAGLEEFTDLKLRNYSSGMKVRLGFSVMVHVDADVLLIDEVLAVGDRAFKDKCGEVFARMRVEGKTIVLVTHDMQSMNAYCDRAMLLHDGQIERCGDPEDVANRYLEINAQRKFGEASAQPGDPAERVGGELPARIAELALQDGGDARSAARRESLELEAVVEVNHELSNPCFRFQIQTPMGKQMLPVFVAPSKPLAPGGGALAPGDRVRVRVTIDNRLAAGRYVLMCRVVDESPAGEEIPLSPARWVNFETSGKAPEGLVSLDHEVSVEALREPEVSRL